MAEFIPRETVRSVKSVVQVDTPLLPGSYHFQLIVLDEAQNASAPADLIVRIVALERPVTPSDDALLLAAREPTER